MYKQYKPYQIFLVVADVVLTLLIFAAVVKLRPWLPGRLVGTEEPLVAPSVYVAIGVLWLVVGGLSEIYDLARLPFFSKQVGRFTFAYVLAIFVFAGFLYFTYRDISRMLVVYFAVNDYVALLLVRYLVTRFVRSDRSRLHRTKVLIVGATETGVRLAKTIAEQHSSVYNLVGFVDNGDYVPPSLSGLLVGGKEDVPSLVREHDVQLVLIALPEGGPNEIETLITQLYPLPVRIYLVPDLLRITILNSEVDSFGDVPVIGIREPVIQGFQWMAKRTLDLVGTVLGLLLLWPLFLIAAVVIKLDSKGPIIFAADRVGANGKIFKMLKFRTMVVGADAHQDEVIGKDEQGRPVFKLKDDPRITRAGKWLRRTSLDELPQLINVLKGEMSIVGPRPEQPFITKGYEGWQWLRLAVPPGITGLWQVSGRSDLPMHLNTRIDIYYARNYSLLLDIKIILKTILVVLERKGAY